MVNRDVEPEETVGVAWCGRVRASAEFDPIEGQRAGGVQKPGGLLQKRYLAAMTEQGRAAVEDVLAVAEDRIGELVDGELVERPRSSEVLSAIWGEVLRSVGSAHGLVGAGRGWQLLLAPSLRLDDEVLVPDMAGWRGDHAPRRRPRGNFIETAPDWVCEVLTPATAGFVRVCKLPRYAHHGVEHVWVVDPLQHTVELLHRSGEGWVLAGGIRGRGVLAMAPFADVAIELARFWIASSPGVGLVGEGEAGSGEHRRRHKHDSGSMHL